jgi:hypothetical protein
MLRRIEAVDGRLQMLKRKQPFLLDDDQLGVRAAPIRLSARFDDAVSPLASLVAPANGAEPSAAADVGSLQQSPQLA